MEQIEQLISSEMISAVNISFQSTLLAIISAIFCAFLVKVFYKRYALAMNNRDYFSQIFILLAICTVGVITIVKYSLALSLGLVGALSIVRFRAAIKEPEELVYLFLIIAIGLAFGSNQFAVGYTLTTVSLCSIYILSRISSRKQIVDNSNLVIVFSGTRKAIKNFKDTRLKQLSSEGIFVTREITIEGKSGRVVLDTNMKIDDEGIQKLIDDASADQIDLNIMTGVHIPA